MPTLEEKETKSRGIFDQVKQMRTAGINDGETAEKAARMIREAGDLMAEVRTERLTAKNAELDALLGKFESDTKSAPSSAGRAGPIVGEAKAVEDVPTLGTAPRIAFKGLSRGAEPLARYLKAPEASFAKALGEGSGGTGGFLVPPVYMQNLFAEVRRQGNVLRAYSLMAEHPVSGQQVLLPQGAGAATVGLVGENTPKPSADQSYTQLTINIFTAAGISKHSKQMVDDSSPTVLDLSARELGALMGNFEESLAWNGTGTLQPRGLLNVTLPASNVITTASNTQIAVIDATLDAIMAVRQSYYAMPTAVIMTPHRYAWLLKAKTTQNAYLWALSGGTGFSQAPGAAPGAGQGDGVTSISENTRATVGSLFGLPVILSANLPMNLGAGTNQDVIVVGNFNEFHWFTRQDVTVDTTDQAGTSWESNQVWLRMEERFGFTWERYPGAFATVGGLGLIQ